jgi:hypothetical protein
MMQGQIVHCGQELDNEKAVVFKLHRVGGERCSSKFGIGAD